MAMFSFQKRANSLGKRFMSLLELEDSSRMMLVSTAVIMTPALSNKVVYNVRFIDGSEERAGKAMSNNLRRSSLEELGNSAYPMADSVL